MMYRGNNSKDIVQVYRIGSSSKKPDWIDKALTDRRLFWTPEHGYQVVEQAGPYRHIVYGKLNNWIVLYPSQSISICTDKVFQENFTKVEEEKAMSKRFKKADNSEVFARCEEDHHLVKAWRVSPNGMPSWVRKSIENESISDEFYFGPLQDAYLLVHVYGKEVKRAYRGDYIVIDVYSKELRVFHNYQFLYTFERVYDAEEACSNELRAFLNDVSKVGIKAASNSRILELITNGADEIDRLTKALAVSEENLRRAEDAIERARNYRRIVEGIDDGRT